MKGRQTNPQNFHVSQIKFYIILLPIVVFMAVPIIFIIGEAFKPLGELFQFPPTIIPQRPTMLNFRILFLRMGDGPVSIWRFILNSLIVTTGTVMLSLIVSVCAGYVLSKKKFKIRNALYRMNQYALMFVPLAVMIPRYLVVSNLGMVNTFYAHILPVAAVPVGLFLIKQFIDQIPDPLIEAAKIDGANDFYIIWKIIVPLVKPALVTLVILTFQLSWGATEASNMYTTEAAMRTLAFFFNSFATGSVVAARGVTAAASVILLLPNLILFIIMQSKVMNTMTHSGIK